MADFDLIVRGGTIVDGSGAAPYTGDLAIRDGWIVEVGDVDGTATEEIEALGLLVTPGFVDIHTHYDGQAIWSDRLVPSSQHGVTTVVIGNCGIGFAPCRPDDRQDLIELMEGVEDIPGAVTSEGLTWEWETFPEFLDALDARARDIDVGVLIPHSPVRVYVMGERALQHEPANGDDCAEMRRVVREGLNAGALGVGTSKLMAHKSSKGELIPSYSAEQRELAEIAAELRESNPGIFQLVTDVGYTDFKTQLPSLKRLAKATGKVVTYTHPQSSDWEEGLALLDEANAESDVNLKAQLLPRPVGMMLGLTVSANPFCTHPTYLRLARLPLQERVAEMRKPEIRNAILGEEPDDPTFPLITFAKKFDRIFITGNVVDYEPGYEKSIAGIAEAQGRTADEVAYDELLKEDGKALLMLGIGNYLDCNLDWMVPLMDSENVVLGLGDGGAHYGMICDASYSTFALTHWARDRAGGRRSIEDMVRRLTREPALMMGMEDRGLIAPGHRAHVNVIDHENLSLKKPYIVQDLPAGGKRLHQEATGYVAIIAHGKVIVRDDEPTAERPGRLIRGCQPARQGATFADARNTTATA